MGDWAGHHEGLLQIGSNASNQDNGNRKISGVRPAPDPGQGTAAPAEWTRIDMKQRSTAMPAKARRHCGGATRTGAMFLTAALTFAASHASAGLPEGLPSLPRVSEVMLVSRTSGLALGGYDAIGYHVSGEAIPGLPQFETVWRGLAWRFATEANRAAFLADPESFVPMFEGLDPVGVARARIVEANPYLFAIHSGRLMLFRTPESRAHFLADPRLARDASTQWPEIARQLSR
jgi:hypothetical protein